MMFLFQSVAESVLIFSLVISRLESGTIVATVTIDDGSFLNGKVCCKLHHLGMPKTLSCSTPLDWCSWTKRLLRFLYHRTHQSMWSSVVTIFLRIIVVQRHVDVPLVVELQFQATRVSPKHTYRMREHSFWHFSRAGRRLETNYTFSRARRLADFWRDKNLPAIHLNIIMKISASCWWW